MRRLAVLLYCVAANCVPASALNLPATGRRAAVLATAGAALPASPANAFGLTALAIGAKRRKSQQQACFDRLECAEAVPAYELQCDRTDTDCLTRRRTLAAQEVKAFINDPGGAVGVFAILLLPTVRRIFESKRRARDEDEGLQ
jgi:hypothetical protein